jgi:hypothetical protein
MQYLPVRASQQLTTTRTVDRAADQVPHSALKAKRGRVLLQQLLMEVRLLEPTISILPAKLDYREFFAGHQTVEKLVLRCNSGLVAAPDADAAVQVPAELNARELYAPGRRRPSLLVIHDLLLLRETKRAPSTRTAPNKPA